MMSARGGHNDPRYKNGIRKCGPQSSLSAILAELNSPVQSGWHWDIHAEVYRLKYAGMEAELRRPTEAEKADGLFANQWVVSIGLQKAAYTGYVSAFTPEVKRDLCQAAAERAAHCGNDWGGDVIPFMGEPCPVEEWADDYGLQPEG